MTTWTLNAVPKPKHKRGKPSRRSLSDLSPKETARLYERSNGVCEKCDRARATDKAHLERRWKSERPPVAADFLHLCPLCHEWADRTADGREWLERKRNELARSLTAQY